MLQCVFNSILCCTADYWPGISAISRQHFIIWLTAASCGGWVCNNNNKWSNVICQKGRIAAAREVKCSIVFASLPQYGTTFSRYSGILVENQKFFLPVRAFAGDPIRLSSTSLASEKSNSIKYRFVIDRQTDGRTTNIGLHRTADGTASWDKILQN